MRIKACLNGGRPARACRAPADLAAERRRRRSRPAPRRVHIHPRGPDGRESLDGHADIGAAVSAVRRAGVPVGGLHRPLDDRRRPGAARHALVAVGRAGRRGRTSPRSTSARRATPTWSPLLAGLGHRGGGGRLVAGRRRTRSRGRRRSACWWRSSARRADEAVAAADAILARLDGSVAGPAARRAGRVLAAGRARRPARPAHPDRPGGHPGAAGRVAGGRQRRTGPGGGRIWQSARG